MNVVLAVSDLSQAPDLVCRSMEMECDGSAPRTSRTFARKTLADWGLEEVEDRVSLIVSELATNAFKHGRTMPAGESETIVLTLALAPDGLLGIEMADNCCAPPYPRVVGPYSQSGRGLYLVMAESDWWTTTLNEDNSGKKVRAFLRCQAAAPAA